MKRTLLTFCVTLCCSMFLTTRAEVYSGYCGAEGDGTNCTWTIDSEKGVLTISGSGAIAKGTWGSSGYYSQWHALLDKFDKIVINEGIKTIGIGSFGNMYNVNAISFPVSLEIINNRAFEDCTGIKEITIPENITYLGAQIFDGCSITKLNYDAKHIKDENYITDTYVPENHPFSYHAMESIETIVIGKKVEYLPSYFCLNTTKLKEIIIPNSVQSIGYNAFANSTNLQNVVIGNGVTSIGGYAFQNCTNLQNIMIPSNVKTIGYGAFVGCGLISITIENGVETIESGAFRNCISLNSVILPNSIQNIYSSAFEGCSSLSNITLSENLKQIGSMAFKNTNLQQINLPNSSLSISAFAFQNTPITEITIPENTYNIEAFAFDRCNSLKKIYYNAKYVSSTMYDFYYYSSYRDYVFWETTPFSRIDNEVEIEIGANVTNIPPYMFATKSRYRQWGMDAIDYWTAYQNFNTLSYDWSTPAYYYYNDDNDVQNSFKYDWINTRFSKITFKEGCPLSSIGYGAFAFCSDLKEIILPETLQQIDECAFMGCSGLTELIIPENVKLIKESALYGCSSLKNLKMPAAKVSIEGYRYSDTGISKQNNYLYDWAQNLDTIIAPANMFDFVEEHWSVAPKNLKYVKVNSGTLTEDAFAVINRSYKQLKTLDISVIENTSLADEAFKGCYTLEHLMLPNNLTEIGYMTVADCKHLQTITIPSCVVKIDDSAFENCRSLKSITFEGQAASAPGRFNTISASASQLQTIGNWAFYNCHELQNLEIPEGVTYIGDGAFYGCVYLEGLSLPSSVQSIGDNCFALCSKLQKIIVNAPVPPSIQAKTFYDVNRQIPVYVPEESVNAYKNDAQWSEFNIQGMSNMPQSINNVDASSLLGGDKGRLIFRDGQIFILHGSHTYSLTGQEIR